MLTNPYADSTGSADVIADSDDFTATLQNELKETQRYLDYPVSLKQLNNPGLMRANSAFDTFWVTAVEKGLWDLHGKDPLVISNLFFVHNTAQSMAALKYVTDPTLPYATAFRKI